MHHRSPYQEYRAPCAIILILVLIRLCTLNVPDLVDTTEGRYAAVAKLMLDKNDWVTPWIHFQGVIEPYLGKPPLHFWMVKASYIIFGLSNFSARLPGVISELVVTTALGALLWNTIGVRAALIGVISLLSSGVFFFLSGACLLDVTLTAGVTLALTGFYLADRGRLWGYLFFCGLALGVLTKGPLAIILVGIVVGPWCILRFWVSGKVIPVQLLRLPWITGTLLFGVLVIPWYCLMEQHNPGFLKYFLLNENFGRFAKEEYGDRYGKGHLQLPGMVWAYMLLGLFPWSFVALATSIRQRSIGRISALCENSLLSYGVLWMTTFPFLLTFARQYTPTYIASAIPGFALCLAILWPREDSPSDFGVASISRRLAQVLGVVMAIGAGVLCVLYKATPTAGVGTAVIGVFTIYLASQRRFKESSTAALALLALAAVFVYGTTTVCMDRHLSEQRSSRLVLERASQEKRAGEDHVRVLIPMRYPFSADFYASLYGVILLENPVDGAITDEKALIVAQERDIEVLSKSFPHLKKVEDAGRWGLFRNAP